MEIFPKSIQSATKGDTNKSSMYYQGPTHSVIWKQYGAYVFLKSGERRRRKTGSRYSRVWQAGPVFVCRLSVPLRSPSAQS